MKVELTRYYWSDVQTRGLLSVYGDNGDKLFSCLTLELPWENNENRVSCIPPGPNDSPFEYTLEHRSADESGSFNYPHFIVRGVEGRSYICIHRGNLYTQILGCILVGKEFVDLNDDGHPDVTRSTETLRELRRVTPERIAFTIGAGPEETGPVPAQEPEEIDVSNAVEIPTELAG